jgi:hypothetical protein
MKPGKQVREKQFDRLFQAFLTPALASAVIPSLGL